MTESVFKAVFELIFFGLIPVLLTVATVWFVWYVLETIDRDEAKHFRSFLAFVLVVVPFVMLCLGGLTVLIYNEIETASSGRQFLPLPPSSLLLLGGTAAYIGLTVWLWSHWRKLSIRQ